MKILNTPIQRNQVFLSGIYTFHWDHAMGVFSITHMTPPFNETRFFCREFTHSIGIMQWGCLVLPICSMVLEYLPTFTQKSPRYVDKYSSTMVRIDGITYRSKNHRSQVSGFLPRLRCWNGSRTTVAWWLWCCWCGFPPWHLCGKPKMPVVSMGGTTYRIWGHILGCWILMNFSPCIAQKHRPCIRGS